MTRVFGWRVLLSRSDATRTRRSSWSVMRSRVSARVGLHVLGVLGFPRLPHQRTSRRGLPDAFGFIHTRRAGRHFVAPGFQVGGAELLPVFITG